MEPRIKSLKIIKAALDAIEELRELAPEGTEKFKTNCGKLLSYHLRHSEFASLLEKIKSKGIADFYERNNGLSWGENSLEILVIDWVKFDDYRKEVREEIQKVEDKRKPEPIPPLPTIPSTVSKKQEISNKWNYVNPFWLLWKLVLFAWKHKIWAGIIVIIGLLGIDYSLAWKNTQWLLSLIGF